MAGFAQTSGKYSVVVTGGNANVGYKAKMNFYRGQRRGYSTGLSTRTTTTRITDPGQLLKDIPASVLSEVVMHLNNPSPLRNNWKAVAAELSLSFQTVQSLDHHAPGGMMEGVLQIMFQRKMTVRDLANMLEEIQRPDIVEILVKAGLPENNIRVEKTNGDGNLNRPCSSNNVQDGSKLSQDGTSHTTSITHIVNGCKQTYNHNQNMQTRREQEAEQNKQTTREQEAKQNMQTTREQEAKENKHTRREQEAKENKQPARDSLDTGSGAEARKITNAGECGDPCTDKSTDFQGQTSNGIIFEEFVGRSQHGSLNYGIPIERSVEESNEAVVGMNDSGGSSIVDRIAAFIVNAYSGSCGRLRFREN